MTTLAIDINGTKLAAALIDNNLQVCERCELPTPVSKTPQALRAALQALATPPQGRTNRVAIASTGVIREGALLVLNPHNLGGLMHFPLTQALERIIDLPMLAVNDAQAATWAEYHAPDGGYRSLVFITASIGVGGGIVSGGKLLTGVGGLAGYLGHMLVDPHESMYGYGRVDRVEATASGRGIAEAAEGAFTGCDAKAIFSRTGQGDEQASRLIHRSVCTLARSAADVKVTTNCQCVVIGGSVGLIEGCLALMEHCLTQEPLAYHVELLVTRYRHDTGLLGAALLTQGE